MKIFPSNWYFKSALLATIVLLCLVKILQETSSHAVICVGYLYLLTHLDSVCEMWERRQCWCSFKMWEVKWNPSLWRDLHDKRSAANPVWKTLTKMRRRKEEREGGREYIMHQFFKMAGHPLCLFTWWHPGCPHPSVGMLSIFQPSLINPETTPPLSFHLPIWPSWLRCLLPRSNCFHKHMPWILLLGSGVRALRVQVIPQPLPLPLHPAPAPCTLHWPPTWAPLFLSACCPLCPFSLTMTADTCTDRLCESSDLC